LFSIFLILLSSSSMDSSPESLTSRSLISSLF
jgi:hypothetical protein